MSHDQSHLIALVQTGFGLLRCYSVAECLKCLMLISDRPKLKITLETAACGSSAGNPPASGSNTILRTILKGVLPTDIAPGLRATA